MVHDLMAVRLSIVDCRYRYGNTDYDVTILGDYYELLV